MLQKSSNIQHVSATYIYTWYITLISARASRQQTWEQQQQANWQDLFTRPRTSFQDQIPAPLDVLRPPILSYQATIHTDSRAFRTPARDIIPITTRTPGNSIATLQSWTSLHPLGTAIIQNSFNKYIQDSSQVLTGFQQQIPAQCGACLAPITTVGFETPWETNYPLFKEEYMPRSAHTADRASKWHNEDHAGWPQRCEWG